MKNRSLKEWAGLLILPVLVALALLAPAYVTNRVNEIQLEVSCQSARSNNQQLRALESIALELGIPVGFTVSPIPPECAGR